MTEPNGARGHSPEKAAAVHADCQPPAAAFGRAFPAGRRGAARSPAPGADAKPDNVTGTDLDHPFDRLTETLQRYIEACGGCVESGRRALLVDLDTAAILERDARRVAA